LYNNTYKLYNQNGNLLFECEFLNNKLINKLKKYYINGNIETQIEFIENDDYNVSGIITEYTIDNNIKNQINFINGDILPYFNFMGEIENINIIYYTPNYNKKIYKKICIIYDAFE
jgi:antitoxin component YwqK of YwqJK toxin-antitoxin module